MICKKPGCGREVPANEAACYNGYHEDCALGDRPESTPRPLNRDQAMPAHAYQNAAARREWKRLTSKMPKEFAE